MFNRWVIDGGVNIVKDIVGACICPREQTATQLAVSGAERRRERVDVYVACHLDVVLKNAAHRNLKCSRRQVLFMKFLPEQLASKRQP